MFLLLLERNSLEEIFATSYTILVYIYLYLPLQTAWIKQEIVDIHCQYSIVIIIGGNKVLRYDHFLEGIVYASEGANLLDSFPFIWDGIGTLDVTPRRTTIADEINLKLLSQSPAIIILLHNGHNSNIHIVTTHGQLIENNILHGMGLFQLPEIDSGIPKADIAEIILSRSLYV